MAACDALRRVGAAFFARGWSSATSSNYSTLLERDPFRLLVTASGKPKGALGPNDFVIVDGEGSKLDAGVERPSAETLLHVSLARRDGVGAVLHTHSVWSTILSEAYAAAGAVVLEGFEMQKALAGVTTHASTVRLGIVDNSQDMTELAALVDARIDAGDDGFRHGYLIRRHGLYTWGRDLDEAVRHVEALEHLFEVVAREIAMGLRPPPSGGS